MKAIGMKLWKIVEKMIYAILKAVFRMFHKELTDDVFAACMQFVKFGMVGLSNTVIGYLIYALSLLALRAVRLFPKADIFIAQFIMFVLSVLWSFYWNNKAVFKKEEGENRNIFAALVKTYITYAFTSLFLSEVLLHLWVNILGISEYVAPIINLLITVPLNFVIQKFWAFKKQTNGSEEH